MQKDITFTQPTVFIIDDDEAVRDSLKMLMESVNQEVEIFSSPQSFLDYYNENSVGCIVLDIRMPGMSGLELQGRLKKMNCILPIIFITGHGDVPMAVQAIKDGAMNFIQKPFRDQELLDLVNDAMQYVVNQKILLKEHRDILQKLSALTLREKEVLQHIIEGKANKVIASDISLSQRTVEIHRSRVMEKMGTKSLAQLVKQILAIRSYCDDDLNYRP